jgi:L-ascorbate metabolism protein UlaG (beta-lactamase superfamily)
MNEIDANGLDFDRELSVASRATGSTLSATEVTITRVINPCALITIGANHFLTDPYFASRWFIPMNEPIGMTPAELPQLTAILGCHGAYDHWQMRSLDSYAHKSATPVLVATKGMRRSAIRAGFRNVQLLGWGEQHQIGRNITIDCVPGEMVFGSRTNCYVVNTPESTIFVGTEACSLNPIRNYAKTRPANINIDIAVLPIDGLQFMRKQLVMNAATALEATRILGAHTLMPLHFSQRRIPGIIRCTSGIAELESLAGAQHSPYVCFAPTGQRSFDAQASQPRKRR